QGGWWTYRLTAPAGARALLLFEAEGAPAVAIMGPDGKAVPSKMETAYPKRVVYTTKAMTGQPGTSLRFQIRALSGPLVVRNIRYAVRMADKNGNGLGDGVEAMMGVVPGQSAAAVPVPDRPHTSFQTGSRYTPAS